MLPMTATEFAFSQRVGTRPSFLPGLERRAGFEGID